MSGVKISALAQASALSGTETVPVVQNGVTVRAQLTAITQLGVYTVPTLAALKALTARPEAVIVETGQAKGVWQWELGSSTTADDGIVAACTAGAAGRYKRIFDGPVFFEWWGAVGDGATDDTVAAQAALDSGATSVCVSSKTFLISTLRMPGVFNFVLFGNGPSSVLKQKAGAASAMIRWDTTAIVYSEQTVRNLGILATSGSQHSIDLSGYSGLVGTVAATLNRQDLTPQIPAFIAQAEAKFNRELRVRDMQKRAQATTSGEYISLPSDYLAMYTLELADNTRRWGEPLPYFTEEAARAWRAANVASGRTEAYSIYGSEIELIDPPTSNIDFRLKYYAKIPNLGPAQTSNWLLVKSPDLYVAGACLEAAIYLKNDDRLGTWNAVRTQIMDAMTLESERALKPQGALRATRRSFG